MPGSAPDLLRLLAVPVLAWAAWQDVRTRRVDDRAWLVLGALGVALLAWELWTTWTTAPAFRRRLFLGRVAVSVFVVGGMGVGFYYVPAGFGGADAKAILAIAVLFPTYPTYYLPTTALPLSVTTVGVFSLTVLTNTVVLGLAQPAVVAVRNALDGDVGRLMVVGVRVHWNEVETEHGKLLEDAAGTQLTDGLDLDALRMYLRWRGTDLAAIRTDPARYRDPSSLPDEPADPGDGRIEPDGGAVADPWGAAAFLDEHWAYGTEPDQLRRGLDHLARTDEVWITPGMPFIVPMFAGLVVALTYGDLLFALLSAVGAV
ncbi:MAG: A24 family peptidase C-terminal domain-containing protein [Haloferacaceae archaeon]